MVKTALPAISLTSLIGTLVATGVHHVFRLGGELIVPALIGLALPIALFGLYQRTGRRPLLWLYAGYAGLIVFWFGFLDGFLDHVAKAAGLDNVTFLPGSEAEVIVTAMRLWSQEATTAFYEGTGVASAVFALVAAVTTGLYVYRELPIRGDGSRPA